jgi:hypothetical protein
MLRLLLSGTFDLHIFSLSLAGIGPFHVGSEGPGIFFTFSSRRVLQLGPLIYTLQPRNWAMLADSGISLLIEAQ